MSAVPEPRTSHEHHAPKCYRHHTWMPHCPDCAEWHRDHLRTEREAAQQRQAHREAAT